MDIIENLKLRWLTGSMLIKLIFINVGVFIVLNVAALLAALPGMPASVVLRWVEMPSDLFALIKAPWTIVTYMFSQYDFLHLLFNMLWLYWFGSIFLLADSSKNLLALYFYGGIGGAALFIASYAAMDMHGLLIGSSASVIAIVTATAIRQPGYKMGLLFLGEISLKWLAIITIAIDLFSIGGGNGGGHIAHLGGAIVGAIYGVTSKKGFNITAPFNHLADNIVNIFKRARVSKGPKTASRKAGVSNEQQLDDILDKIKKSGYGALSAEEKQRLFDISRRIK